MSCLIEGFMVVSTNNIVPQIQKDPMLAHLVSGPSLDVPFQGGIYEGFSCQNGRAILYFPTS